jgi:hypothetical protein
LAEAFAGAALAGLAATGAVFPVTATGFVSAAMGLLDATDMGFAAVG